MSAKFLRAIVLLLVFSFFAFGTSKAAEYQIRYVATSPPGSTLTQAVELFAKLVKQHTNGAVEVEIFTNGKMGEKKFTQIGIPKGVADGEMEMGFAATSNLSNFYPKLGVFDMPYLFRSDEHFDHVLDGPIGKKLLKGLLPFKLHGLAYLDIGLRLIMTTGAEIHHPADLKGLKLRILEGQVYESTYKAWGAVPVPISIFKVLDAAKNGYVQGEDQSYAVFWEYGHAKTGIFKIVNETYHSWHPGAVVINEDFFEKLPKTYQMAVENAAQEAAMFERKELRNGVGKIKEQCKAIGIKIVTLTPEERKEFKQSVKPVYDEFTPIFGKDLLDAIENTK